MTSSNENAKYVVKKKTKYEVYFWNLLSVTDKNSQDQYFMLLFDLA